MDLQLAGNGAVARKIVTKDSAQLFLDGIWQDCTMFIPGYALFLAGAFALGHRLLYRDSARLWARRGFVLTVVMALADMVGENLFLALALYRIKDGAYPDALLAAAACFALLKWTLAVPLIVTAFWILGLLLARGLRPPPRVVSGELNRSKPEIVAAGAEVSEDEKPDVIVPPLAPHDWVPRGKWAAPYPSTGDDSGTEPGVPQDSAPSTGDDSGTEPGVPQDSAPSTGDDSGTEPGVPQDSAPSTGDDSGTEPGVPQDSAPSTGDDSGTEPGVPQDSALCRWRTRAYQLPGRKPAESGFCVSGGGIRSAAVTMGALQALRRQLLRSRYLVSVSGGGYTAGALQLALTSERPTKEDGTLLLSPAQLATPADAFAAGSPEEDHVRRHAKYLADSPKDYLLAAGTVLRGLAVSFGLLTLAFAALGQYLHLFYTHLPLTDLSRFTWRAPTALELRPHAWVSVVALLGLAGVLSVVFALVQMYGGKTRPPWQRSTVTAVVGLAAAVSVYVIVLPAVIWFFAWLAGWHWVPQDGAGGALGLLGAITAAATALGTVFVIAYRGVKKVLPTGQKAPLLRGGKTLLVTLGSRGWIRGVVCWLVLLLVAFFGLALMSWTAVHSGNWHWAWQAGVPVVLVVLAVSIDQTVFSLHPFYRRRLAGAFSLRRAVLRDGSVGVVPYDYSTELTLLSRYAARVEKPEAFPQVLFVASAAVSTRNRTAPGRPAVPFTFASDYVGGPDTGWVRTDTMENTAPLLIRRDLTVQSAVAISGAAFASAMGTQTMFMERLLALTNLRLGSWIPNPLYLAELLAQGPDRRMPRLPRVRRLRYQLQELVNRYSDTSPLLLCTDGGHFDNLGLVELLRLRCRTVYVIDASGDDPPLATTLAQAVTLAYEELGVRITFDGPDDLDPLDLVPGSGTPLGPATPMKALNARFSKRCAVRGTITYPEPIPFSDGKPDDDKGTIIFVKANLTSAMPYELLSYAVEEEAFPRVSTMDQWFDHTQFDAYRALGHFMGMEAAALAPPYEP
ncbi:hypothetical protein ATE80_28745 [Streptomyces kanasensis]|uniref:Uncharacterized protein n=1 Tax=Streptomyces kanasensis TaxID=936756 RepID=A0A100Y0M6_9ACTN|nr:hypothetical protein ATE80_28745 [Streptomyces kanasensis]